MRRALGLLVAAASTVGSIATAGPPAYPRWHSDNAVQVRLGGFFPDGGGELWDGNEAFFTMDASDFDGFILGFSLLHSVSEHVEIGLNLDHYDETSSSSYRDPIPGFPDVIPEDADGFPIVHDTRVATWPLTVDVRFLPWPRARGPRSTQPLFYFGGGVGIVSWKYEEVGDFIEFTANPVIIRDQFQDTGTAFEAHVLAGLELPLTPRTNALFEGRWSSADDELGGDFAGFGKIDLSGTSVFTGLSFRF